MQAAIDREESAGDGLGGGAGFPGNLNNFSSTLGRPSHEDIIAEKAIRVRSACLTLARLLIDEGKINNRSGALGSLQSFEVNPELLANQCIKVCDRPGFEHLKPLKSLCSHSAENSHDPKLANQEFAEGLGVVVLGLVEILNEDLLRRRLPLKVHASIVPYEPVSWMNSQPSLARGFSILLEIVRESTEASERIVRGKLLARPLKDSLLIAVARNIGKGGVLSNL